MSSVPRESLTDSSKSQRPYLTREYESFVNGAKSERNVSLVESANTSGTRTLSEKLKQARTDLLDLTLRNNMLNYRLPKRQGLNLNPQPVDPILPQLIRQHTTLRFHPSVPGDEVRGDEVHGDEVHAASGQPESEGPASERPASGHPASEMLLDDGVLNRDGDENAGPRNDSTSSQGTNPSNALVAPYTYAVLQNRLLQTFRTARSVIEEQGVNTLFLAMGFLEWYEADSSDKALMAPLMLVPVQLERDALRDQFTLKYTDEEMVENLSLRFRAMSEFHITLPSVDFDDTDATLSDFFNQVEDSVRKQKRWKVHRDKLVLGFFSFSKYLMFHDLNPDIWPESADPLNHPVLSSLLGDGFVGEPSSVDADARLDDVLPIADMRTVLDADSSQLAAVVDVSRGRNLVIQGPPGTGKSQTITNVISRAVMDGKSVLFVAEKMAALEVVKSRLERVGLGPACLELHSNKTNKRQLLVELDRTWQLPDAQANGTIDSQEQPYQLQRQKLNDYVDVMHRPMAGSGVTPYHAMGTMVQFHDIAVEQEWPTFEVTATWSHETFAQHIDLLSDLQAFLLEVGVPLNHPFWGCKIDNTPVGSELQRFTASLDESVNAIDALRLEWTAVTDRLGIGEGDTWAEVDSGLSALKLMQEAPDVTGTNASADAWYRQAPALRDVAKAMRQIGKTHAQYDETLLSDTWKKDLSSVRLRIMSHKSSMFRAFSGEYKAALREAWSCLRHPQKQPAEEMLAWVGSVMEAKEMTAQIMRYDGLLKELLGPVWQGEETDWFRCADVVEWLMRLHAGISAGDTPKWVAQALGKPGIQADAATWLTGLGRSLDKAMDSVRAVTTALQFEARGDAALGESGNHAFGKTVSADLHCVQTWRDELNQLPGIVLWNMHAKKCDAAGLKSVTAVAATWPNAGSRLVDAFRFRWYEALLQQALKEHDVLARFAGSTHGSIIERFCAQDDVMTQATQRMAAKAHLDRIPARNGSGGEVGVLRREIQKKARHMPIRKLLSQAGHAVQGIKPVFMASPLSVSTFLPPGSLHFDLVVFDEASQVLPTDAFGPLLRGRQLVVVGDSKQLPPTNFFDVSMDDDDGDEAEEAEMRTSDMESILGLCVSQGMPERMLRWHYRSRHESLIAVSNSEFYDGRLVVFPSPNKSSEAMGLVLHHMEDSAYDRGKTRTNRLEARAVATAVLKHARAYVKGETNETLGVVAFSSAQAGAIEDEVDNLRRKTPEAEAFFSTPTERFFVKNLETVQGDERDVILISVGYGRDANGYLALSFGPLGKAGGERRLNVLISRARVRCEVFTNLKSDDIDLHRAKGEGTRIFKTFLKYCETGILDVPHSVGREMDSPFEVAVRDELIRHGYQVDAQVGSAGFFIDLAVVDANNPARYLLGIECDGRTYHSSKSARDRDRLRQNVLESLGWKLHRIWSTDWFRDKRGCTDKLIAVIEQIRCEANHGQPWTTDGSVGEGGAQVVLDPVGADPVDVAEVDAAQSTTSTIEPSSEIINPASITPVTVPYVVSQLALTSSVEELHAIPIPTIADWIHKIVEVEAPVHVDVVVRRIAEACGVKRVGNRIQTAFDSAVRYATRRNMVELRNAGFLFQPGQSDVPLRTRHDLPAGEKKMGWIAGEEISGVILALIDQSYGYAEEDLIVGTTRELGFHRATQEMRSTVAKTLLELLDSGRVRREGINYVKA